MSDSEHPTEEKVEEKNVDKQKSKDEDTKESTTQAKTNAGIEAEQEAKLRSKYPMGNRPMAGHSALLQKRLAKGQKYFDSGDYQMAKQKTANPNKSRMQMPPMPPHLINQPTGDAIPTPESVPVRKTSIIQHTKLTSSTAS